MTFIEEILAEAEIADAKVRVELSRLRADQTLAALGVLEKQADEVNKLAESEIIIIQEWRQQELQKIEKKAQWLEYQLEQYIRSTDEKTINLPHGSIKLRMGREKVEITDMEKFLRVAPSRGLIRSVPESYEPDMPKVLAYLKTNGFLTGVKLIPGQTKFSYNTKGNGNGETAETEA